MRNTTIYGDDDEEAGVGNEHFDADDQLGLGGLGYNANTQGNKRGAVSIVMTKEEM